MQIAEVSKQFLLYSLRPSVRYALLRHGEVLSVLFDADETAVCLDTRNSR